MVMPAPQKITLRLIPVSGLFPIQIGIPGEKGPIGGSLLHGLCWILSVNSKSIQEQEIELSRSL